MIATPGTLTPRPRSKCVSTIELWIKVSHLTQSVQISPMATARRGQENDNRSTSLRAKRNGMFFDEETSNGVARRMSAGLESSLRQRIQ